MSNDLSGNSLWGATAAPSDPSVVLLSYQNGGDGATAFTPTEVTIPSGYREIHVGVCGSGNGAASALQVLVGVGGGAVDALVANYPGMLLLGYTTATQTYPMSSVPAWNGAIMTGVFVSNAPRRSSARVILQGVSLPGVSYWGTKSHDGASPGYLITGSGQYTQTGVVTSVKVVTANSLIGEVVVWGVK